MATVESETRPPRLTQQSQTIEFVTQLNEPVLSTVVQLEGVPHQRPPLWVDGLRLPGTRVQVSDRGSERVDALPKAFLHPLERLVSKVADVVGGHHRLDVGCEPSTSRPQVEILSRKANVDPGVDQLAEVRPVSEIASASVDLVDHHAGGSTRAQELHESSEHRAAAAGGRLTLFHP